MKREFVVSSALIIGCLMAATGCSSKSTPQSTATPPLNSSQKPNEPDASSGSDWTLKLQSKCQNGVTDDQCLGAYGFTVFPDGRYQIGPTSTGAVKNGSITPDELKTLTDALAPALSSVPLSTANHETIDAAANPSDDTVTFTRGSSDGQAIVQIAATDFSYRLPSSDQAKVLFSALKAVAARYYALPFPDTCGDTVAGLQTLFTSLQTCTTNQDCVYLDSSYNVLDPSTYSFLTTDDCTMVTPLSVANSKLLDASRDKIATLVGQANDACGARMTKADCTSATGFQLNGTPAVCKQGVCQSNQSASTTH